MAYNPISASELPADDPFFDSTPRDISAKSEASQLAHQEYVGQLPQTASRLFSSQETNPAISDNYFSQRLGNDQPGWGRVSPLIATGYLPQTYGNQRDWSLLVSPTGGNLSQTTAQQLKSNPVNSPNPRVQSSTSQPPSVKHLTCWYWANKGCKLADNVCLYAHFDTGRLADPPVQIQRGREFPFHHLSLKIGPSFQTSLSKA